MAAALVAAGHVVRGTTRDRARTAAIEAAGAEAVIADPDRIGMLMDSLRQVSVVVILLGSASGSTATVSALHGPRLEMLLSKLTDTTVRGIVYEAEGSVARAVLEKGARHVVEFGHRTHARCELLVQPGGRPHEEWAGLVVRAVERVLAPR